MLTWLPSILAWYVLETTARWTIFPTKETEFWKREQKSPAFLLSWNWMSAHTNQAEILAEARILPYVSTVLWSCTINTCFKKPKKGSCVIILRVIRPEHYWEKFDMRHSSSPFLHVGNSFAWTVALTFQRAYWKHISMCLKWRKFHRILNYKTEKFPNIWQETHVMYWIVFDYFKEVSYLQMGFRRNDAIVRKLVTH